MDFDEEMYYQRSVTSTSSRRSKMSGISAPSPSTIPPNYSSTSPHFSWCASAAYSSLESSLGRQTYTGTSTSNEPYPQSIGTASQWVVGNPGPPPLNHWKSPYSSVPLPSLPYHVYISHLLQRSQLPNISWDLRTHFSTARCPVAPEHWLESLASSPGQRSLAFRTPLTDRPIVVFPGKADFVTIGDVLEAIHQAVQVAGRLRRAVERSESEQPRPPAIALSNFGCTDQYDCFDRDRSSGGGEGHVSDAQTVSSGSLMWGGMVESPTEKQVWILLTHETC